MKKLLRILGLCLTLLMFVPLVSPTVSKADGQFCYKVKYSYSHGDCLLQGDVTCLYCDEQQIQ